MESGDDKKFNVELGVSPLGPEMVAGAARRGDDSAAPVTTTPTAPPAAAASSTRPYYECMFCKRGFTTAQALGGHMNIHRRHRHRNKPPGRRDTPTAGITSTVSRGVECYNQPRYLSYPPPLPAPPATPPTSSSFTTYYASGGTAAVNGVDEEAMRTAGSPSLMRELSLFGGADTRDHDLHLRLGRHGRGSDGSPPARTPEGSPEWLSGEVPERKLGLDLELRLGRRPRH